MTKSKDCKYARLIRYATEYAKRAGYEYLAEDFAQEVAISRFLGEKKQMKYLLADFLRKELGRADKYGSPGDRAKAFANFTMQSLDEQLH